MDRSTLMEYMQRVGLSEIPPCTAEGIKTVQQAHLRNLPFENLDIIEGRIPLDLSEEALVDKMIRRRRGGICYEMNTLLSLVYSAMGFTTHMKAARIKPDGTFLDHVFVLVEVPTENGDIEYWMSDGGFAFNYQTPLLFQMGLVQNDGRCDYRLDEAPDVGEGYVNLMRMDDGVWTVAMTIAPGYVTREEYQVRCDYYATNPNSRFKQGAVVGIDCPEGRITLSSNHIITYENGIRVSKDLDSPEQFKEYLHDIFDLD